jgi:hypothetical protein
MNESGPTRRYCIRRLSAKSPAFQSRRRTRATRPGIALNHHGRRRPAYVEEYEAERFAAALMQRDGFKLPRSIDRRGRGYVSDWIVRGLRHGLRSVDHRIARWALVGDPTG